MNKQSEQREATEVYINFDDPNECTLGDKQIGMNQLGEFICQIKDIAKRAKDIQPKSLGVFTPTQSLILFEQAKKLYILGLFESSIMVSRATAEYIANELLEDNLTSIKNAQLHTFILDNIDFRKAINGYLSPNKIIKKEDNKALNKLYDIGNRYVHPKRQKTNPEKDAREAIELCNREVIMSLYEGSKNVPYLVKFDVLKSIKYYVQIRESFLCLLKN